MARQYKLQPRRTKNGKWRLSIVAQLSPTGKRQQLYFDRHSLALAAADNLRKQYDQFGRSLKFLGPARLAESVECWELLDKMAPSGKAAFGQLRNLVIREQKAQKERSRSVSLNALFDQYLQKLKLNVRDEDYIKSYKWCRGYFREVLEEPVSDLKSTDIAKAFEGLSSGQRNGNLRQIRAVLNCGLRQGFLKSNPAEQVEFIHREKVEVKPLANELVRGMLQDAARTPGRLEMLPYLAIGFFCGCREAELSKILWSDLVLPEKRLLIRAAVSKTRNSRYIEILGNGVEWLQLYLAKVKRPPKPEERVMRAYTRSALRKARVANWSAAVGTGTEPQNSKRRTCASCHLAFYQDEAKLTQQLGHTTIKMSREYAGAATKAQATEYFSIRPS